MERDGRHIQFTLSAQLDNWCGWLGGLGNAIHGLPFHPTGSDGTMTAVRSHLSHREVFDMTPEDSDSRSVGFTPWYQDVVQRRQRLIDRIKDKEVFTTGEVALLVKVARRTVNKWFDYW